MSDMKKIKEAISNKFPSKAQSRLKRDYILETFKIIDPQGIEIIKEIHKLEVLRVWLYLET